MVAAQLMNCISGSCGYRCIWLLYILWSRI